MKYLQGMVITLTCWINNLSAEVIYDEVRDRNIPIEITHSQNKNSCTAQSKCSVAFLSAGYGVSHLKYAFLSQQLSKRGYLVIAIGHELPNDPALSVSGNLYETRSENWSRGAKTLDFLKGTLSKRFKAYNFEKLLLIGHSNGGDISAWLGNENKHYIQKIITLDHRRVPLPRNHDIEILSIRASDFPADKGVLPSVIEQEKYGSCVVDIPKAKHSDMSDFGPSWLKDKINLIINKNLNGEVCSALMKA